MRRFIAFLFVLAFCPQLAQANYAGKIERGISPWYASRGPGDAYWDRLERLSEIGLLISDYSATDADSDDHPILEEGGAFFAVRTPAKLVDGRWKYEQDRDALWAVVVPHMYQLAIPFLLPRAGQFRHVAAHDGNRVYDQSRVVGPEGGFALDPNGRNAIVLRCGTPEHRAFFDYVRVVRDTTKRFAPDSEKGRLDVNVDRERISKGLRALFDVLRILSSVSIFFGNMDRTGKSWDWAPGRYARAFADPSYRYEDFVWRKPAAEPFDTRGDKAVPSRRQSYRNFKFWYLATKRFEELEVERQRDPQNPNWHRDYFLRQCVDLSRRHNVVSPRAAPVAAPPQGDKEDVELGKVRIGERDFYTFPKTHNLGDALDQLRPEIGNWSLKEVQGLNQDFKHNLEGLYLIPAWRNEQVLDSAAE